MKAAIKAWFREKKGFDHVALLFSNRKGEQVELDIEDLFEECMGDIGPKWISVDTEMPKCVFETTEWDRSGDTCHFDGDVSQSLEITDGEQWARGHYKDDGTWTIYDASHDFLLVDPDKITHWMPMIKLPA